MGFFSLIAKTVALPLSVAVDIVKAPIEIVTGEQENIGSCTEANADAIYDEI